MAGGGGSEVMTAGFILWVLLRSDINNLDKWQLVAVVDQEKNCAILATGMNEDLVKLHPTSPLIFICSDKDKTLDSIRR